MECRGCALCCVLSVPYLDVHVLESDKTPSDLVEYRSWRGKATELGFWMKRKENGECIALESVTRDCLIYDLRPEECRVFDQSHPVCDALLRSLGD